MAIELGSNYAALKGGSESSLEVSQLLGPEDGLKVVALQDGSPMVAAAMDATRCSFWQPSRSQTAPKLTPMSKDVPAAAGCVSRDES